MLPRRGEVWLFDLGMAAKTRPLQWSGSVPKLTLPLRVFSCSRSVSFGTREKLTSAYEKSPTRAGWPQGVSVGRATRNSPRM